MTTQPANTASTTSRSERARRVEEALHSLRMEGLDVSAAGRADAKQYVDGRIGSDELVGRARARHGLG